MRLLSVDIQHYKRFASPSTLQVNGPLVAIVGPNEAGKTSLLKAMEHLSRGAPFLRTEYTGRRQPDDDTFIVRANYAVEPDDRAAAGGLLDDATQYVLHRWKRPSDTDAVWDLVPRIQRDPTLRHEFIARVERSIAGEHFIVPGAEEEGEEPEGADEELHDDAAGLVATLRAADEDLGETELEQLRQFAAAVRKYDEDENADVTGVADACDALVAHEAEDNPTDRAGRILLKRVPRFLLFDGEHRELDTEYDWGENPAAPDALDNLCSIAGVDYESYRSIAVDRERRDELHTIEAAANNTLREVFASWTQAHVTVAFRADSQSLALHVFDEGAVRAIPFDQRSAGLRGFVALIAFVIRYAGDVPPVLLIDEAETHLHYGGQADLIEVFERQSVAQTIIYTTHSIGCLPDDLGTTIRAAAQLSNERSEVRNGFWSANATGAGLTPLMLAMGAEVLAFTPSRFAVIGEGPTEAILLPSLFREARAARHDGTPLGFQVAPGVARVSAKSAADLELDAGNVAYLVDADDGGRAHADKLADRVKYEGRLVVLGDDREDGLCTEDFLDLELYVDAVNATLGRTGQDKLTIADLPNVARPTGVATWCKKQGIEAPAKTDVAVEALALARQSGRALVEATRKKQLAALYERFRKLLGIGK